MNDVTRRTIGYAAVGLVLGFFLFPFVYILATRSGMAVSPSGMWLGIFLLILLGPGLLFGLVGRSRKSADPV